MYDQAILATPEYFDFTDLEEKVAPYEKPLMNGFMVHLPPLHVMQLRMAYSGLPNNYFATLNSFLSLSNHNISSVNIDDTVI